MKLHSIVYPNISKYHKYFEKYNHARNFVNLIQTQQKGTLHINDHTNPTYLHYQISGINILEGDPKHSKLENYLDKIQPNELIFYPNSCWEEPLLAKWCDLLLKRNRNHYDSSSLQLTHIQRMTETVPSGYTLRKIGAKEAGYIDREIRPFVSKSFGGVTEFLENGVGYCLLCGDKVTSFAVSYFPYTDYIEIHVETHMDFRGRGLATFVAAKLIEYCLENDIEPGWDASHEISDKMAYALGYSNPKSYEAYYLLGLK